MQSNQRQFSKRWVSPSLSIWLFVSFSLLFDSSGTISHWWQCTALPLSLMEASVCYYDGIPLVAKFTEKEICIIVRRSQSLLRDVCVYVWISMYILVCVLVCCRSERLRSVHHLWAHLFLFVLPSAYHRMAHYACCGCVCVCVQKLTYIDGPTRSISWVEVWNQPHPREIRRRNRTEDLATFNTNSANVKKSSSLHITRMSFISNSQEFTISK